MEVNLDLIRYNEDLISIRDMESDIDISSTKWDEIFNYFLQNTGYVYFQGLRRWIEDDNLMNTINYISKEILIDKENNHVIILCKLKSDALTKNRVLINRLFYYYEYPILIFIKDTKQEIELIKYAERLPLGDVPLTSLSHLYTVSRESQLDVLWLRKSSDMDFPWKTTRSSSALEEEIYKPWYKKALNSLGFYWDVKITRNK